MQVVHMNRTIDRAQTDLVGRADYLAAFHSAAGHPDGEAIRIVIAALVVTASVLSSRPRDLRSASRPAIGWSTLPAMVTWLRSHWAWPSQSPPAVVLPDHNCTKRTPRSTSLRAIKHLPPNSEASGSSKPYRFRVAAV